MATQEEIKQELSGLLDRLLSGARVLSVEALSADEGQGSTGKALGYGRPLKVTVELSSGALRTLVFRTQSANEFGHDRRADRAEGAVLAFDTFGLIPQHAKAVDVGVILEGGGLQSLRRGHEFYLLTEYAQGLPYANDLRRVTSEGQARPLDFERAEVLGAYLAQLHQRLPDGATGYRRAVRDLIGHGECIFGIVDGYPPNVPGVSARQLRGLEERCLSWRWSLRAFERRLCRTHGDFHPFNVLFDERVKLTLLDASRGCQGEAADDLTAMAVNYVFFALDDRASWREGLGPLWRRFWETYLSKTHDEELLQVAPPFFAWRALVVCNPRFYPAFSAKGRQALLGLAEYYLDAGRLDLPAAEGLFP